MPCGGYRQTGSIINFIFRLIMMSGNAKDAFHRKIGGAHTTIIGGRTGRHVTECVAVHEEVKKIIPSVISVKNNGRSGGFSAKVLRPDERGNLRLLIVEGRSFQEIRLVTTVANADEGERLVRELNDLIDEALK